MPKFGEYRTLWDEQRQQFESQKYGRGSATDLETRLHAFMEYESQDIIGAQYPFETRASLLSRLFSERSWLLAKRPFYRVWPGLVDPLSRLDLDKVTCQQIPVHLRNVLVQLPVEGDHTICYDGGLVHSFLCADLADVSREASRMVGRAVSVNLPDYPVTMLYINLGHHTSGGDFLTYMKIPLTPGRAISDVICKEDLPEAEGVAGVPNQVIQRVMRLYCTVSLLTHDEEQDRQLVDRCVLNADRQAYENSGDPKFIEKAERRGVVGWDIGRGLTEKVPHYRRPHFGIRWTGPGKTIPRIRPIKGSIVHRDQAIQSPTGYLEDKAPEPVKEPAPTVTSGEEHGQSSMRNRRNRRRGR